MRFGLCASEELNGFLLSEYMAQAEKYFQKIEVLGKKPIPRVVYISSDNTSVINEARSL